MNCKTVIANLDNYLDGYLDDSSQESFQIHLDECQACRTEVFRAKSQIASLKTLPVPPMDPGFQMRAFRQARKKSYAHKMRYPAWIAVAAVLILFVSIGVDFQNNWFADQSQINVVEIEIDNTKDVRLVFNSNESLKNVSFALELPDGIELVGFGNQRKVIWRGDLEKGRNLLVLPVIARNQDGGVLIASIHHADERKQFKLRLNVRKMGIHGNDTKKLHSESDRVFMTS
jgi:hypothetical protein